MPVGETVALAMVAGLLGGVVGAVLAAVVITRQERVTQTRLRLLDAYAQWLAARLSLTRASGSFLAAFRSLAAERRDSAYSALRRDEAQRARSQWCEASRKLDGAEAQLLVFSPNGSTRQSLNRFHRVHAEALRLAINGDESDVHRLLGELRAGDQKAIDFVRTATAGMLVPQSRLRERLALTVRRLEWIIVQWSLRAGETSKRQNIKKSKRRNVETSKSRNVKKSKRRNIET